MVRITKVLGMRRPPPPLFGEKFPNNPVFFSDAFPKLVVMIMFIMVMMMVVMNMMTIRACGQCGWCLMGQVSPGNQKKSINFFPSKHRYSHLNSISRTVVGQSLKSHSGLRANIDNWMFLRQKDGKTILMQEFTWSFGTGPLSTGTPRTRTKPSLIKMVKMVK